MGKTEKELERKSVEKYLEGLPFLEYPLPAKLIWSVIGVMFISFGLGIIFGLILK